MAQSMAGGIITPMKLWIDDIRTPPDDTWHIARSVSAAIRAIDMFGPEFTAINLDHDISHQIVMSGMLRPYACEETFEAVARFMVHYRNAQEEVGIDFHPLIHIHTSNPVGAANMKKILEDANFKVDVQIAHGANRLETIL